LHISNLQKQKLTANFVRNGADYSELFSELTDFGILTAWKSNLPDDPNWDGFLDSTPYGQFHQTSKWAQVRILDGWKPLIIIITHDDTIVGGFQILVRTKSHLGKIGLVLKGPVVSSNDASVVNFVIKILKKVARSNHINALIVQPPDRDKIVPKLLKKTGFSDNHLQYMIKDNTVLVDLRDDEAAIFSRVSPSNRKNIRKAVKNGLGMIEADKKDLTTFFSFMRTSCQRQKVSPSPSDVKFLEKLWDVFSRNGNIKLFFSGLDGEFISAQLLIPFGDTAYLWKGGWSGNHSKLHPNDFLNWETLKWAKANGYSYADIGAIDKTTAALIRRGEALKSEHTQTYSYFKLSFGGEVMQLTEGFIYICNPLIRGAYNLLMPYINSNPFLKKRLLFKNE
jgi:lipid II:glycine glycyltransferase (peptidoglycan interpeptide bridge formation enzyme)